MIAVARKAGDPPFDADEMAIMEDFAHHAAVALTLCRANEQARRLTVLSDRERIARGDPHAHVIQRLFLAGMDLQGTIARTKSGTVATRLSRTVDDLQSIIDEIRTAIFDLQSPAANAMSFRQRIQASIAAVIDNSSLATTVRISGPIVTVDTKLADGAEAVIPEAVSNAVRHSGATSVTISIDVSDHLEIVVIDNGRGIPDYVERCSGLRNLKTRPDAPGEVVRSPVRANAELMCGGAQRFGHANVNYERRVDISILIANSRRACDHRLLQAGRSRNLP